MLTETKIELPQLTPGFSARPATLADIEAATELFNTFSMHYLGINEAEADQIKNEWKSPGFDPARDIRVVFAPDGKMVGYIEVWTTTKPPVHPWIWGRVHPDYEGLGIGTYLNAWAEKRARQVLDILPDGLRVAMQSGTNDTIAPAKALLEEYGYKLIRHSFRMRIEFDQPVPEPEWPQGIELRPYKHPEQLEAVYRADVEAFRDHFGFIEEPFESGLKRYKYFLTENEVFDPSLWFLAMDGDEIAGLCLCRQYSWEDKDLGWVSILGVRRPWRRQGVGLALLRHAFNEFYRRGKRKVGLGVDASSLTGATHLYERAGMHVHRQFDQYEKELRPGKELATTELED
jgi:mycothiol synthase